MSLAVTNHAHSHPTLSDLANVHALPAELLRAIFIIIADTLVDNVGFKAPPCMFLSHVCGRWRAISLAYPELWLTSLPRESLQWTQTCLSRCPSLPLKVDIDVRYSYIECLPEATALVMNHWSRVRELSMKPALYPADSGPGLSTESQDDLQELFGFLARPNNCLEKLEFDFSLDVGTMFDVWLPVYLPQDLFSTQPPPRLHELKLTRCSLPAAPPLHLFAPSLRTLELVNIRTWRDVDVMIQYLQAMPMLERFSYVLWKHEGEFDCRPSQSHQPRCVHLPRLEDLGLQGFWLHNLTIFNYISIPSHCRITFDYRQWDQIGGVSETTVLAIMAIGRETLKQHFAPATSHGAFYSLVKVADEAVCVNMPQEAGHGSDESAQLPTELRFYLPSTENDRISRAAFQLYLTQPVMTKATRLYFTADAWRLCPEVFDEYTAVRELCLTEYDDVMAFTTALRLRGPSLFPALKRVVLIKLVVRVQAGPAFLRDLADAIQVAHVVGGSFECLELEHCYRITGDMEHDMRVILGSNRVVRNQPLRT
ncbi:hypothetical protein PENSPDRAFT_651337 [Peniophora sp. CONT]|nr:hypothetical protein PENSPDRAFT_651337 [Peniophora sp. CONT]